MYLCCCVPMLFAQTNPSKIALLKKTLIGGEGGWDYLTVSNEDRRLYISHGDQVEVLNADTHVKIGVITDTKGVHGICALPSLGKGYITNGKTNTVTVFDTKTLKHRLELPTDKKPDALLYDKFSNRMFIFNNDGQTITVIDVKHDTIIKTIAAGGSPETGVTNEKGTIFVNLEDTNEIIAFDSKTLVIKHRFKLNPGEVPTGLAFDKKTHRLFSTCRKNQLLMVVDSDNGRIVAQLPIGKGVDGAVFDEKSKLIVCSNGEGSFTVVKEVSADTFEVLETIQTESGARTIAFDPKTKHFLTTTAQFGEKPAPTPENPKPRPAIVPNTFMLLEFGKK
jgi:DNA-binding beta-propeller fold protein YncE